MKHLNPHLSSLRKRVAHASTGPGVYRWKDKEGNVLYVGKAKNLRNRLRSYVSAGVKRSAWTEILVSQIADFDLTLTNTDLEALMLETNLIKGLKPKFNIIMKDDKNYVYLRISLQDTFPRVDIVRRMEKDGAYYIGPKTSAERLQRSLTFLSTLFPFRTCKMGIEAKIPNSKSQIPNKSQNPNSKAPNSSVSLDVIITDRDRPTPCIDYHIKRCSGPCIGCVTPEEYRRQSIDGVIAFFQGKYEKVETVLVAKMSAAVQSRKFERAAELRDHLKELRALQEKQLISDTSRANTDFIGAALLSGRAHVVLLKERDGKLIDEESFSLKGQADCLSDVLAQFIPQYYQDASDLPDTIITGEAPGDHRALEQWLTNLRGKKVGIHVPERGKKSKLLLLAEKNADWKARQSEAKWESELRKAQSAIEQLQSALALPSPPKRIECYDISHMGGSETVGSMVVFENGKPRREHYRSFNMRTVKHGQIDDYQSLRETLKRRLKYLVQDLRKEESAWNDQGITFGRARKDEQAELERIISEAELGPIGLNHKDFLVARHGENIVACGRIYKHQGNILELKNLWVSDVLRNREIGQFIARKLLRTVKKGKVYVTVNAQLEQYYSGLGFRYVITPPKILQENIDEWHQKYPDPEAQNIVMVYDTKENKMDESFTSQPDLILIDGGKGQLAAAKEALDSYKLEIPLASLAKREEEIFIPGNLVPVVLAKESAAQFLLQRLRDEAHRFANDRRERRGKRAMVHSALDDVPGIGDEMKSRLLKKFGTTDGVRNASDEELLSVMNQKQLEAVREYL